MACMEHQCDKCGYHEFDNTTHHKCPQCGATGISNWWDEETMSHREDREEEPEDEEKEEEDEE